MKRPDLKLRRIVFGLSLLTVLSVTIGQLLVIGFSKIRFVYTRLVLLRYKVVRLSFILRTIGGSFNGQKTDL